ncbi:hypothetical protein NITGR_440002 [Nitrospina gracilis 3/211]|uniref:Uncharacterized protein n=1 Tax=Nitrospina gracilis (strain 3/211) TaxID=1266370 RepID=M1YYR7_NITG3|nr:hypothetical protein NITGR_440002 [Nitrospina gracilis 3/211]
MVKISTLQTENFIFKKIKYFLKFFEPLIN